MNSIIQPILKLGYAPKIVPTIAYKGDSYYMYNTQSVSVLKYSITNKDARYHK